MSKLLIKNVEIISAPDNEKYFLGIDNDTISVISKEMPTGFENAEIINASDKIAVPGLVNTHTHAAMTLLRSYADDMVLMDWLQNKIWPAEAGLNDEDIYWGTMLSIAEMLKTGTTCFADMYFAMDKVAQAVNETGIRASLSRGLVGLTPDADEKLQDNEMLFKNWHGKADGRIRVMFGPHAPYTCPVSYLKKVVAKAGELNAEIHMHLCETAGEVSDCVKEHNMTPIKLMNSLDMFDCGTLAAHCVHVSEADLDIMADKKVRVAHNPQSNLKLASGIAPVKLMLETGIKPALGTDGNGSNNNLDMFRELFTASVLQKGYTLDAQALDAYSAVEMATVNGAAALGYKGGRIKEGFAADVLVLYPSLFLEPVHDVYGIIAYSAESCDVRYNIVNGRVLVKEGECLTVDKERAAARLKELCAALF